MTEFTKLILGFIGGLLLTLIIMPIMIPLLHKIKFGQSIREEGPKSHFVKKGTPTMGGLVFIFSSVLVVSILEPTWIFNKDMICVLLAFIGYGLIGFIDDFIIVVQKNNKGLSPKAKFLAQSVLAVIFFFLYGANTYINIPFIDLKIDLSIFYFLVVFIMFTGETNGVNLTDGLDGLCAGTVMMALAPFALFALNLDKANVALIILTVIGSLLGFLRFNMHPAKIFMGDTGSLALGGLLAAVAMITKQEVALVIIGLIFLIEPLSVMIQVYSFKKTGKRVFKMAPLHHHFELSGYNEVSIVLGFWILGFVLSILGFLMEVL